MKRAAVLIGVNRVKGLPALNDAVRGAARMREWALAQGFAPERVRLVTDEAGEVTVQDVRRCIGELLDPMAGVEQLLIYFAGHGLNINYGEYWLLTGGIEWPAESVDVARSAVLARYCSVPHVVFISDACRTAAVGVQQQFITGSPIFPGVAGGGVEKAVDQFFACTLGNPALEVQAQSADNAAGFTALYTEALLEVLGGGEPTIIEVANDGESPDGVIRPWPLKRSLRERVSRRLIELNLPTRAFQTPDARITSEPDVAWLARLAPPPPAPAPRGGVFFSLPRGAGGWPDAPRGEARELASAPGLPVSLPEWVDGALDAILERRPPLASDTLPDGALAITDEAERRAGEFGPRHFETRCGIKLRGAQAVHALCPGTRIEWAEPGEVLRAYPRSDQAGDRVLLVLADGSAVVVPLLPEFIAELGFENGEWVNLAYEPSDNSPFHPPDPARRAQRRELREFVAAAVERGVFQPDRETLEALVALLLDDPVPDPVLLLFLAYALDDAGLVSRLRELVALTRARGVAPLFDVALLAHRPGEPLDALLACPPGMPLLARGWAGLAARGVDLPDDLAGLAQRRLPTLWTCFNAEAGAMLLQHFSPMEACHA